MASYNIIVDDLKVRIEHIASGQKQSFPRSGYRVELRNNGVNIVEQGSGVKVFTIREAKDLGSITDNRTTAGATTPISTLSEIYDILDATATPFFFLNLAALAADVLHDPFLLQDGTINPGSLDGTGNVRAATAYPNSIGFNSITPDQNNSLFANEFRGDSTTNKTIFSDLNSGFRIEGDTYGSGDTTISDDGAGASSSFGQNWIYWTSESGAFSHDVEGGIGTALIVGQPNGGHITNRKIEFTIAGSTSFYGVNYDTSTPNEAAKNIAISSRNTALNGATYTNSVFLGGNGGTINKSDYAFAQNLEVQGGTLNLTTGSTIEDENGNARISLNDFGGDGFSFTSDNGVYGECFIEANYGGTLATRYVWMGINEPTGIFQTAASGGAFYADTDKAMIGAGNTERIRADKTGLGFFAVTPIAQPTTAGAAAAFTANTSGIADDTATFDGYTIGKVVKALRNLGILA